MSVASNPGMLDSLRGPRVTCTSGPKGKRLRGYASTDFCIGVGDAFVAEVGAAGDLLSCAKRVEAIRNVRKQITAPKYGFVKVFTRLLFYRAAVRLANPKLIRESNAAQLGTDGQNQMHAM